MSNTAFSLVMFWISIYLSRTELTARLRSADLEADAVGKVADEILALKNIGSKNSCRLKVTNRLQVDREAFYNGN